ncbi:hypothetical protein EDB81DRAFT_284429 [Dactylonectria macrodidyma]|uniref:Very long-chain fatty acid transport protein n=1 Tax=Dactylonectria macrodidyma TaxID=307937 RepID=A0A9P9FMZ4_9HYPO|nr:hypothetical protein EDB81DRAFT_284429 [Dactylonectria macrodidyma]
MYYREYADRLNLFYLVEAMAKNPRTADRVLLVFEGRRYSYAEAYDTILRYGHWLRAEMGVKPKDVVAMDFQNSPTFVFLWWGLWSIGAKPAFINYNLAGEPLTQCLRVATSSLCIIDPDIAGQVTQDVRDQLPDMRFLVLTPDVEAKILAYEPVRAPDSDRSENSLSNLAILIYTSGTTGLPKPAIVSWGKLIVGGTVASKLIGRGDGDIMYTSMPLYHSSASVLAFCGSVLSGSTIAIGRKFSATTFWDDVRQSGATSIQYVGETLRYLLATPPQFDSETGECLDRKHSVRVAFGNGLRPDIWNEFKDRFGIEGIAEFYAATEGTLGTWNLSKNDLTAGAIGRNGWIYNLVMSFNVSVVEVDWDTDAPFRDPRTGRCRKTRSGEPGEMLFQLPAKDPLKRFQGYFNNPAATESKLLRDVFRKGDVWFRTGDVVRWDSDGRVFFHDRIGDTFRWKSENVSTAEVSHALGLHPAVKEANVYGVELPHHDGRAGCAAVFLAAESNADTLRSIATHVQKSLPKYARPIFLRVMGRMGDNQIQGTNKQQKTGLRAAGVKPASSANDDSMGTVYWLNNDTYAPFTENDWRAVEAGRAKL